MHLDLIIHWGMPFEMVFAKAPLPDSFSSEVSFDHSFYQAQLRAKLAALQGFIETHMLEKATHQKTLCYDSHSNKCSFKVGDLAWL